jgi:hypothetical protein
MTDLWLLKFAWPSFEQFRFDRLTPDALRIWRAVDAAVGYATVPAKVRTDLLQHAAPGERWIRLDQTREIAGASAGADAPFHYIVETDVLPEHEAEFNAWYDEEHLPGLAAVPGTVRAARYVCPSGSPRYYACYDLASQQTFGSPRWLAVRATDWSSRVRPSFRNTRRTMFQRVS